MKFTFVIPTRERTEYLKYSIRMLLERTYDLNNLEIAVAFDKDDEKSLNEFKEFQEKELKDVDVITWVAPKQPEIHGNLIQHCNSLAKMATGDWIVGWGDCIFMYTQDWDRILQERYEDKFYVIRTNVIDMECWLPMFFILPKKWVELLGRLAPVVGDLWIGVVAREVGILKDDVDIKISHMAPNGTAHHGQVNHLFWERKHIWEKDIQILRKHIESINQEPLIYPGPKPY